MDLTSIFGATLLILIPGLYLLSLRSRFLTRLYSPLALSLCMALLLIVCLCMGFIRQQENRIDSGEFLTRTGMRSMQDSALLLGILLLFTVLLGMLAIHRFHRKSGRFSNLIPLGLFVTLASLLLGSFALERYEMNTWKNANPSWVAFDGAGQEKKLPFALAVNDFRIDYHDPVLYIVDSRTGSPLPEKHPQKLTVDPEQYLRFKNGQGKAPEGRVLDHDLRIIDYIPEAWIEYSDGKTYCTAGTGEGFAPAVLVEIASPSNRQKDTAWISCGSVLQVPAFFRLDTVRTLGMGKLRTAGYTADITLYEIENQAGEIRTAAVRPNRPVKAGKYNLYLKSYKENHGFWDPYITIEIIRDPWKAGVNIGIILLLAGLTGSLFRRLASSKKRGNPKRNKIDLK